MVHVAPTIPKNLRFSNKKSNHCSFALAMGDAWEIWYSISMPFFTKFNGYLLGSAFRKGATFLTFLTLTSYGLGLVRDMLFSRLLGASRLLDVYNAAFVVPDILLNVFVAGALTAAFVPVFSHLRAQGEY